MSRNNGPSSDLAGYGHSPNVGNTNHSLRPQWLLRLQVEWQCLLKWFHGYNTKRIHGVIGYITLNDVEDRFYAKIDNPTDNAV